MTHDELLDKIYWYWRHQDTEYFGLSGYRSALRAVVELHKPWVNGQMYCQVCVGQSYPCQTIQQITKELK